MSLVCMRGFLSCSIKGTREGRKDHWHITSSKTRQLSRYGLPRARALKARQECYDFIFSSFFTYA